MTRPSTKPGSRVTRVIQAVAAQGGECTTREYLRLIKAMNDGDRHDALAEDLRVRGFIERKVVLTAKGRAALLDTGNRAPARAVGVQG